MPSIVSWGITQVLQQQGLTNVAVQVSAVGRSQSSIERLSFVYQEPETLLQVGLEDIHLAYSLEQLIGGQVQDLLIDKLEVKLDYQPGPQQSTSATLPSIDLLLAVFDSVDMTDLPINSASLPNISILHNLASETTESFEQLELRAQLSKRGTSLMAEVFRYDQQALSLEIDPNSGWQVQYYEPLAQDRISNEPAQRQPIFTGVLSRGDQSLLFSAELNPGSGAKWSRVLEPFDEQSSKQAENTVQFSELELKGTIRGAAEKLGLAVSSQLKVRDLNLEGLHLDSMDAKIDTKVRQLRQQDESLTLSLASLSNVSLDKVSYENWQASNINLSGNSEVILPDQAVEFTSNNLLLTVGSLSNDGVLELSDSVFSGEILAATSKGSWQLELSQSWNLGSKYVRLGDYELPQGFALTSTTPVQISAAALEVDKDKTINGSDVTHHTSQAISLNKTDLDITLPVVNDRTQSQTITVGSGSLQIQRAELKRGELLVDGTLLLPEFAWSDESNQWQFNDLNQVFLLNGGQITSRGSMQSKERGLSLNTVANHDLKKQEGDLEFRLASFEFSDSSSINQLVYPLELPIDLVSGELDVTGNARWKQSRDQWESTIGLNAKMNNLGGVYDELLFSGFNGQLSLQVYPEILSSNPHKIVIDNMDMGIASTDTTIEFVLRPSKLGELPIIDLRKAQTQILQGSMSVLPGSYDLNETEKNATLVLENIDLSELVDLHQLEDIRATGRVFGQLPVSYKNGEFSIDDGQLQAVAPGGTLKYHTDDNALKANKYAETIILALRDFNYDVLRAETQYNPDGTLKLDLRLQGNNPDFENGRPVNLNINLEQNVLKLFESLRLIEGVSDTLDKRVQDFYQQSKSQ